MIQTTSEFGAEIRTYLTQFKQICRSNQPKLKRCKLDINDLQIKRRQLRHYNDTELYSVVETVIQHIEQITNNPLSELYEHKGMSKFTDELRCILDNYTVQNNNVIHIGKYSARIHVSLLQNVTRLREHYTPEVENTTIKQIKVLTRLQHPDIMKKIKITLEEIRMHMPKLYRKINLISKN